MPGYKYLKRWTFYTYEAGLRNLDSSRRNPAKGDKLVTHQCNHLHLVLNQANIELK